MAEIEDGFFIVAFDRENLFENGLQAISLAFGKRNVLLQEIDIGIELNLNEIRGLDPLFNASEVNALCPV
jgi:hypothetical protein